MIGVPEAPTLKDNAKPFEENRGNLQEHEATADTSASPVATTKSPKVTSDSRYSLSLKRFMRPFANLKLAIAELGAIAGLSSVGTIIEQNKDYAYYLANYPNEGEKVAGFVTADLIWALQLDHIYRADYFLVLMALLAVSLAACTATNQWPSVKVAQRWRFKQNEQSYANLPVARRVPEALLKDFGQALQNNGYQLFIRDGALYAFKGLAGKLGPIGVHASMLAAMAGIVFGILGGYSGSAMIPEGGEVLVSTILTPASPLARLPKGGNAILKVDDFRIDYRSDGSIKQFFSDVEADDINGKVLSSKTMSVNMPLRFDGVTAYQTDWSMSALTIRVAASGQTLGEDISPVNIPMANLEGQPGIAGRLFAAFLPIEASSEPGIAPKGISFLARDLQTVTIYDTSGQFAGVRRPGSGKPIDVDGIQIVIDNIVSASGMELKSDPGVPLVYAGFGGICVTTVLSYLSHSQVWAYQSEKDLVVGGRSNRAKYGFEREINTILESLP